jgi:hypothetical protein
MQDEKGAGVRKKVKGKRIKEKGKKQNTGDRRKMSE